MQRDTITQIKLGRLFQKNYPISRQRFAAIFVAILSLSMFVALAQPKNVYSFEGGDGSSGSPYQIATCTQLQGITNASAYYELVDDVVCDDTVNWNGGQGFIPVPAASTFTGSFDGNTHTISGLYMNRSSTLQGLFRSAVGANIFDVNITGAQVTATGTSGILVGSVSGQTQIANVSVSGTLAGTADSVGMISGLSTGAIMTNVSSSGTLTSTAGKLGGVLGEAGSTGTGTQIIDSHSTATISGGNTGIGGLVGVMYFGSYTASTQLVLNAYATGNITATGSSTTQVGGLIGYFQNYRVYRTYATGNITSAGSSTVGGLVGYALGSGEILESYAAGNVTATSSEPAGGLVGSLSGPSLSRSFAVGNVRGFSRVGGLVGTSSSSVVDSYSRGRVTASSSPVATVSARGSSAIQRSYGTGLLTASGTKFGFAGDASFPPTCSDTFWDTQTTAVATSQCTATGKTTSQMQDVATFTNTGTSTGLTTAWDFTGTQNNDAGNNDYWAIDPAKNSGYPYLSWQSTWPDVPPPNNSPTVSTLGPANYVNATWGNDTTPSLTFSLADIDSGDTVRYQIQIDDTSSFASPVVTYTSALGTTGSKTFTVGQAAGSGTYAVGSAGQTLSNGSYYWRVKAIDNSSAESSYSTANSGAVAIRIDTTSPTTPGTPSASSPTNDTTPTWTWTASTDAGAGLANPAYTVQWSQSSSFSSGVNSATSNTNSYTHGSTLADGTWYLRVYATDTLNYNSVTSANGSVVIDTTAPTVSSLTPADNASGIALNANLVLTFDENVSVNSGNVLIKRASNDTTLESISISSGQVTGTGTTSITINPSVNFAENTSYYIQVPSGALRDAATNSYAGISDTTSWSFTTVDLVDPVINYPSNNTAGNLIGFNITLGEAQLAGSTRIVFTGSSTVTLTLSDLGVGTHEFILDPANPTSIPEVAASSAGSIPDGTYSVVLSHQDAAGLSTLSSATVTSIAIDTTAPELVSLTPADNAGGIAVDANLVMEFDEPVGAASGEILIKKKSDNTVAQTLIVGGGVPISGNGTDTLTIDPNSNLAPGTTYYVEVPSIAVRDLSGNDFAGFSGSSTWTFTTALQLTDKITPSYETLSLQEGQSREVSLLLDEPIVGDTQITVAIESANVSRATVSTPSLAFADASWAESREFTIQAVEDTVVNGDEVIDITLTVSSAAQYYDGYQKVISLTVVDDEIATPEDNGTQSESTAPATSSNNQQGAPSAGRSLETGSTAVAEEESPTADSPQGIILNSYQDYTSGTGKLADVTTGQVLYFDVGTERHSATVTEVGSNYVVLVLASTPQTVKLMIGETGQYDVNQDGKKDIEVTIKSITGGVASVSFKAILERAPERVGTSTNTDTPKSSNNMPWILLAVGVAVVALLVIRKRRSNKSRQ